MNLQPNHICTVKLAMPGNWPAWYLARIAEFEEDEEGNWNVSKFQVVGETYLRDTHEGLYVIRDEIKERQAQKLAATIWTPKAFKDLEEVRKAITEIWL